MPHEMGCDFLLEAILPDEPETQTCVPRRIAHILQDIGRSAQTTKATGHVPRTGALKCAMRATETTPPEAAPGIIPHHKKRAFKEK